MLFFHNKESYVILFRTGPSLCSPFFLRDPKTEVSCRCQRCVQRWPSLYWARYRLPETRCRLPHPEDFQAKRVRSVGLMTLILATLNSKGLRDPSKCVCLLGELTNLSVNVIAVQKTYFTCAADCRVLEDDYVIFSGFGSRSSVGFSLLIGRYLNADENLVLADDGGRLVVADVTVKSFEFRVATVYAPNIAVERVSFYR